MKISVKRINTWTDKSEYPEYIEIQMDESTVYEGPGDATSNAFVDGFLCSLDAVGINFEYTVEDIED